LNVRGMAANRCLARSIMDGGFFELRRQLTYKARLYGARVVVAGRFYPSSKTCSCCGVVKETLALLQRMFACDDCGFEAGREAQASRETVLGEAGRKYCSPGGGLMVALWGKSADISELVFEASALGGRWEDYCGSALRRRLLTVLCRRRSHPFLRRPGRPGCRGGSRRSGRGDGCLGGGKAFADALFEFVVVGAIAADYERLVVLGVDPADRCRVLRGLFADEASGRGFEVGEREQRRHYCVVLQGLLPTNFRREGSIGIQVVQVQFVRSHGFGLEGLGRNSRLAVDRAS
jgi:hypothetical protein